jgi:hypothetical protein
MTMSAHEHEHDQEQEQGHNQGHGQDNEWERARGREEGRHEDGQGAPQDTPHLYRAAVAGRADVVGAAGLGVLQRAVGNSAVGLMVQRSTGGRPEQGEQGEQGEQAGEEARSPVRDVVSSGGGQPLDAGTRADLESRMGADFSDVRVHNDAAAHESAKSVGAHAYTVGTNVVFQRDAYDPSSPQGRTTLAHELTHVIQQRNGPVEGTDAPGGIRVSDPGDRFEQEAAANADRVVSAPSPSPVSDTAEAPGPAAAAPAADTPAAVQRAATEDEDEQPADVQGSFVQRAAEEGGGEEEEEAPPG